MRLRGWKMARFAAGIIAAGLFILAPGRAFQSRARYQEEVFPRVRVTRDIVYKARADANGRRIDLRLDLYEPEGDAAMKRPLMVWLHGGEFPLLAMNLPS